MRRTRSREQKLKPWPVGKHKMYDPESKKTNWKKDPVLWQEAEIMLDRDKLVFFVDFAETRIEDPAIDKLRLKLDEFNTTRFSVKWQPVIWAEIKTPYRSGGEISAGLEVEINRFYIAKMPNGEIAAASWSKPAEMRFQYEQARMEIAGASFVEDVVAQRMAKGKSLPIIEKGGDEVLLKYDDELWAGLERVLEQIDALRERLSELMAESTGRDIIRKSGNQIALTTGA